MRRSPPLAALVILAAACRPQATPVAVDTPGSGSLDGPFARPFLTDRTVAFDVASEREIWDDQDPAADATGNVVTRSSAPVTCQIKVGRVGGFQTAIYTCPSDGQGVMSVIETSFVTDGERLWKVSSGEVVDELAAVERIAQGEPVLSRGQPPIDRSEEHPASATQPRWGAFYRVEPVGDGWCIDESSYGGDESGSGWCWSADEGLVSASSFFAGGSSREDRAELRRTAP